MEKRGEWQEFDQQELDGLLDEFGVIVIPDDYGNYAHNSAFYLVDPNGKLSEVMDFRDVDAAAETILAILDSEANPS